MFRFRPISRLLRQRMSSAVFRVSKQPIEGETPIAGVNNSGTICRFLKFASLGTLATGCYLTYITYAYSVDEVKDMADPLFLYSQRNWLLDEGYWEKYRNSILQGFFYRQSSDRESTNSESPCPESAKSESANREYTMGFFSPVAGLLAEVPASLLAAYLTLRIASAEINAPLPDKLLPEMSPDYSEHTYTLVLDVEGTLLNTDWTRETSEYIYISKRPGLEDFIRHCKKIGYEIVLYSDEYTIFAQHYRDELPEDVEYFLLTAKSNVFKNGNFYRDLSRLARDPSKIIYVSANGLENCLQLENWVPIKEWKNEEDDTSLADLLPFLEDMRRMQPKPKDLRPYILQCRDKGWKGGVLEGKV